MISHSEQQVLEEICNKSRAALLDIHTVIGKVYDEELALDLNKQAARYSRLQEKAEDNLIEKGIMPAPIGIVDRTKRWAALQAKTVVDDSAGHVAELIEKENAKRLKELARTVKENDIVSTMTYELAEEFMDFEADNIRILKSYYK